MEKTPLRRFILACFRFVWFPFLLMVPSIGQPTVSDLQITHSECDPDGMVTVTVAVFATDVPPGDEPEMTVRIGYGPNGINEVTYTGTPTRVTRRLAGTGSVYISARIENGESALQIDTPIPLCPNVPAVTDIQLLGFEPCGPFHNSVALLEITAQNIPTNTTLEVRTLRFGTFHTTPINENALRVRLPVIADSSTFNIIARFLDQEVFRFKNLGPLPDCPQRPSITDVAVSTWGPCRPDGTRMVYTQLDFVPPWPGVELTLGTNVQIGVADRMTFQNVVPVNTETELSASFLLPFLERTDAAYDSGLWPAINRAIGNSGELGADYLETATLQLPAFLQCQPCNTPEPPADCRVDITPGIMDLIPGPGGRLQVQVPPEMTYFIEAASTPTGPWQAVSERQSVDNTTLRFWDLETLNPAETFRFFRLRIP